MATATIIERNGRFTAQVRKKKRGLKTLSISRTFGSKDEALAWATSLKDSELELMMEPKDRPLYQRVHKLPRLPATTGVVGVYFLFNGDDCVYVGQSTDIHGRVRSHKLQRDGAKDFDSYAFVEVNEGDLDSMESYYIFMLNPVLNKCRTGGFANARKTIKAKTLGRFGVTLGQH